MRLIALTSKRDGLKVYVNPTRIKIISQCFGDEGTIIEFGGEDNYIKVLESVETVAIMVEGERNG